MAKGFMHAISRRQFMKTVSVGAAALAAARLGGSSTRWVRAEAPVPPRPNILFILADDLGWRDTSLYGSTFYETPNVERLAKRGMMFTQAYAANPLCSPTRASIQTGLWPARIGITAPVCHMPEERLEETLQARARPDQKVLACESATRLKLEYFTLAEAMKAGGYHTGHFGKWHLGPEPYDPLHQGYDVDVPHYSGPGPAGSYVAPWKFPAKLNFTGQPGEHLEDRMSAEAAKFIRENKDRPFFMTYWCFSVHAPFDAKKALVEKYRAKADQTNPQHNALYAAMVQSMDDAVGRLLDTLDELDLARNTIIVFFSDNGGVHWTGHTGTGTEDELKRIPITSNAPLRGGKATIYEGGTREPCVVIWPGRVKPGTKSDAIIQSIDFYPTLLEMAGLKAGDGRKFDGISVVPVLTEAGPIDREAIFCHFPHATPVTGQLPAVYVRKGDWKLIRFFHDGPAFAHRYELYNLREDIGEAHDLAGRMPEKVKELDALIERFLTDSHAVVPRPNPAYNPSVLGWEASKDATLSVAGGLLVVESTGTDPNLANRSVPKVEGDLLLEFRMRSTASGLVQIFWAVVGGKPVFHAGQRLTLTVAHDGQWHVVAEHLPVKGTLSALRIDPATGPGRIELEWIRLKDAGGKILKEWTFAAQAPAAGGQASWATSPIDLINDG